MEHNCSPRDLGVVHFGPENFNGKWNSIDPRWLVCADLLQEISGIILRVDIKRCKSCMEHGPLAEAERVKEDKTRIYGVCILPCYGHATRKTVRKKVYELYLQAQWCGFSVIGFYPWWRDEEGVWTPGFYLGTHRHRRPWDALTWGGIKINCDSRNCNVMSILEAIDNIGD